ncbi:BspA family leucine-rich repeat surface protein [Mesonia mobilis]|uniref:BspA family leucine-rich repeat surface protein n=2 Tax=Mesonia mobilis TaxID=369791 RepID=UPI0026EAD42C|nr:BspA family leucine-rich repeat surface protein [Mesonia mobilis]
MRKSLLYFVFLIFTSITCFSQNAPFITTWEVDASDLSITIPTNGTGYNYTVNFGDGTVLNNQTGNATHIYSNAGTYTVSIVGDFPRIRFGTFNFSNNDKIKSVEQWGDIVWHSMSSAFQDCSNLVVNATDAPDLSLVTNMSNMFSGCSSFNQSIDHWDISNVTNLYGLFSGATSFNQPLNGWDVSNVENMTWLFLEATSFNQPIDNWDVTSVVYMTAIFQEATSFNQPLNTWDVSNAEDMTLLFALATSFNQPLNNWDVANVENMSSLFNGAISFDQPLDNWDVSSVIDMRGLFSGATSFNQPLNSWDVSNVVQIGGMFNGAISFNQVLDNWDVSSVENMRSLFDEAIAFDQPLNSWDVSSVIDMSGVFRNATSFNQPLDNWDVSNVEIMGEHYGAYELFGGAGMFEGATTFNQPLNTWDVSNVSNMGFMFFGASSFNQPLSNWDVSNVEHMGAMFQDASAFNQDLSSWGFNQNVAFNSGPNNNLSYSFVSGTNIDVQNYDLLLGQFSSLGLTNKNLDSFGLAYCDFNTRSNLINNLGWTITGDNLDANCTNGFITTWEVDATDLSITIPTSGAGYNYTVNFGDGTILNNQTGDATHTYANAGTYTVGIAGDFPRIQFGDSNSTDNDKIKSIENWGDIVWQSMQYAFSNCNNLVINTLDAPDLSLVEDMSYMFLGCSNFNQSINHWDVSNVELMTGTFQDAIVFNQDLSSWSFHSNIVFEDTQNITTTGFLNNTDLNIQNYDLLLAQFSSLGLTNKYLGALSLEYCDFNARFHLENSLGWSIAGDSFNISCDYPFVTTWEVTNDRSIFIPTLGSGYNYTIDFGDGTWLSNQTGNASHTYASSGTYTVSVYGDFPRIRFSWSFNDPNAEKIKSVEEWGIIKWQTMEHAFEGCSNLVINAIDAPDLSLVENMSYTFAGCSSLNQNINHWDVSNVELIDHTFINATSFDQPLNNWNVSNVTNMAGMFEGATSFNQDISNWDVSNVIDLGVTFGGASAFNQDLSSWDFNESINNYAETFNYSGLDVQNYDALLQRFVELGYQNKALGAHALYYCDIASHNELVNNLGWTIYGDQLDSNCSLSNDTYVENNLVVYPNPTQGKLFVEAEVKLKNIEVFNVLGQKINLRFIQNTAEGQQFQTDLSSIENGVYFLKIYTDEGYQIERIVKNL